MGVQNCYLILICLFPIVSIAQVKTILPDIQPIIDAENNFARMSVEKDMKTAFLSNLNDSTIIFEKGKIITNAREAIEKWKTTESDYLFWWPVVADIASSGELGYTTGPYESGEGKPNPIIRATGYYATVWKKDEQGVWKMLVDLGTAKSDSTDKKIQLRTSPFRLKPSPTKIDQTKERSDLMEIDHVYNGRLNTLKRSFAVEYFSVEGRMHRGGQKPLAQIESIKNYNESSKSYTFEQSGGGLSLSADMAYTFGVTKVIRTENGDEKSSNANYLRVWKKENGKWKLVLDVVNG